MKPADKNTHDKIKSIFEALNYNSGQIGAALNISAKAAQQKKNLTQYCKFTAKDLDKTKTFLSGLNSTINNFLCSCKD